MPKLRSKGKKQSATRKANLKQDQVVEADGMVLLRSNDGVEFMVSKLEASQSMTIKNRMEFGAEDYLIPFDGDKSNHTPIHLGVQGKILSKVVEYWKKHASGSQVGGGGDDDQDPSWDANFVDVGNETLCDLILAASYLRAQGLLNLTCHTVAKMIKGKSSEEIRSIFKITSDATRRKEKNNEKYANAINSMILAMLSDSSLEPPLTQEELPPLISIPKQSDLEQNRKLKLEVNALRALHIVRCQEFTAYDPKMDDFICTRFCDYNIAFFDLDKLSMPSRGPPLHSLREPKSRRITQCSVNVISLKVVESDVGYPFSVFGTVLARDEVDYRCVYLFRRRSDDAQFIHSPDDTLTLSDPCRGLDSSDKIYFEINLKIKTGGGGVKDFSKGLLVFDSNSISQETVTGCLISYLSSVELAYVHVPSPLEVNIAVKILKGPCKLSRIDAATSGHMEDHFITLYDIEAEGTETVIGKDGFVVLTRHMVAVPLDEKLVLFIVGEDGAEHLVLRFGHTRHSKEHYICKMGCGEVQVIVAWTAIPRKKRRKWEVIGGQRLLQ